jgi:hypothetical protein
MQVYCHLIATTGHSWDQVRNDWDLPRLFAWSEYCGEHPTLRNMVQRYLGIETKATAAKNSPDILETLTQFPGAFQTPST